MVTWQHDNTEVISNGNNGNNGNLHVSGSGCWGNVYYQILAPASA